MNIQPREKGQILVLLVLAIVGIFGFAALAVDMGRVYAERRRAQNAADAAAYAAAFKFTQSSDPVSAKNAGIASAQKNGFNDTNSGVDINSIMDVQINNPPAAGSRFATETETIKPYNYFQVIIRSRVDPIFAQFVYGGLLEVTVEAIAMGTAQESFTKGNSIVAVCPTCCYAISFTGNGLIDIADGGVTSNSDGTAKTNNCPSFDKSGDACVMITDGSINVSGVYETGKEMCSTKDLGAIDAIDETKIFLDPNSKWNSPEPPTPTCSGTDYGKVSINKTDETKTCGGPSAKYSMCPGNYSSIKITGDNTLVRMAPGLYCLDGDLQMSGGSIVGDDVMFYVYNDASININTSGSVILSAPEGDTAIPDDGVEEGWLWSGFLVLMPNNNDGQGIVKIVGGSSSDITGTIYAPYPPKTGGAKCTFGGNNKLIKVDDPLTPDVDETTYEGTDVYINASIICWNVDITGSAAIHISYYDDTNYQNPPMIELSK